jgi:hypothetical protein
LRVYTKHRRVRGSMMQPPRAVMRRHASSRYTKLCSRHTPRVHTHRSVFPQRKVSSLRPGATQRPPLRAEEYLMSSFACAHFIYPCSLGRFFPLLLTSCPCSRACPFPFLLLGPAAARSVSVHTHTRTRTRTHAFRSLFPFLSIISLFFSHSTKPGRAHDMALYNALLCAGDEAAMRARAGARWVLVGVDVNSAAEVLEGRW